MKQISSRDNPTARHLRALVNDARERRAQQRCVIEGAHLLSAALDAGWRPLQVCFSGNAVGEEIHALRERCEALGIPVVELAAHVFEAISDVRTPAGVLAELEMPAQPNVVRDADVLVLDAVQDAGNVGTLMRTAVAAGVRHVWLGPGCAQAWSPKVLRAAQGAHFAMQIAEVNDLAGVLDAYAGQACATVLADDARDLYACDLRGPTAWLFGSEGQGLSAELAARANVRVMIPMPGTAESLNVAAAAAVCLFEQVRQRRVSA